MDDREIREFWQRTIPAAAGWDDLSADITYRPPGGPTAPTLSPLPTVSLSPLASGDAAPAIGSAAFDLMEEVGRGGMGIVFRAVQRSLRREIAVKQLLPDIADPAAREGFVAEALVTGLLDHPNIVPVHELARSSDGQILLAMKLVGGTSWRDLLHPSTPEHRTLAAAYDLQRHIDVLKSVCNAVAFAHSKGIIHRDLKPENVMVGGFGEVLVMDWGLALDIRDVDPSDRRATHKSAASGPAGTPRYMSPEQAAGRVDDIGPGSDVYLLGAILHEILTGRPPHKGSGLFEVLKTAAQAGPPVLPESVPAELRSIVERALAPKPLDRYRSVAEFRSALGDYLKHRASTAISDAAEATLAQCEAGRERLDRNSRYAGFAEAVAGFKQARLLWKDNEAAIEGERRARLAYAESSLEAGDLGLAEAQAAQVSDAGDLNSRIETAKAARVRSDRNARVLRWSLAGTAALITIGLGVGFLLVTAEQRRTAGERDRAEAERRRAEEEKASANERLAYSYLLRARLAAEAGDGASEAVLFVEGHALHPTEYSHARAARSLGGVAILRDILTIEGKSHAVAFHDAGYHVVASGDDNAARVWDSTLGGPVGKAMPHEGLVMGAAFSPRGDLVATRFDRVVRVWNPATGEAPGKEMRHALPVHTIAFSADGMRLVTGSWDGTAALWIAESGRRLGRIMRHRAPVLDAAFSPDGTRVVTGSADNTARLWDAETGKPLGEEMLHESMVHAVAFSPDGTLVATGSYDSTVRLWNGTTGSPTGSTMKHDGWIKDVTFSPDGRRVATASQDKTARLWGATGEPLGRVMRHESPVMSVAFSPDGEQLVTTDSAGAARLWDARTGAPLGMEMRHGRSIRAFAFSSNGKQMVTVGLDETARLWDLTSSERASIKGARHASQVYTVAYSPDGTKMVTGCGDGTAWLYDAATGSPLAQALRHDAAVSAVEFSPDGKSLVTICGDYAARLWDAERGIQIGEAMRHDSFILDVAFSPDGTRLMTGGGDNTARLWDAHAGKGIGNPMRHDGPVISVAFNKDGKLMVTGSGDKTARLWNGQTATANGKPIMHAAAVVAVAFSPDGKSMVTGCGDNASRLWDAQTQMPLGQAMLHDGPVTGAAFGPGGDWLATVGEDSAVRIWDAKTGERIGKEMRHGGSVSELSISPDGSWLVTASPDNTARLWHAKTGEAVGNGLLHAAPVVAVAFSPDGTRILTGSADGTARLWDVSFLHDTTPPELLRLRAQVKTGLRLDARGEIEVILPSEWRALKKQLDAQEPAE